MVMIINRVRVVVVVVIEVHVEGESRQCVIELTFVFLCVCVCPAILALLALHSQNTISIQERNAHRLKFSVCENAIVFSKSRS